MNGIFKPAVKYLYIAGNLICFDKDLIQATSMLVGLNMHIQDQQDKYYPRSIGHKQVSCKTPENMT